MHVSFFVIIFLAAGMVTGFLLHEKKRFIKLADTLTSWTIYLFLFLLGLSVGVNEEIVNNIGKLGIKAFVLTGGAVAGSIMLSYIVYRRILKIASSE